MQEIYIHTITITKEEFDQLFRLLEFINVYIQTRLEYCQININIPRKHSFIETFIREAYNMSGEFDKLITANRSNVLANAEIDSEIIDSLINQLSMTAGINDDFYQTCILENNVFSHSDIEE